MSFGFLSALADDDAARWTRDSEASALPATAGVQIDVQSFLWVLGSDEYADEREAAA